VGSAYAASDDSEPLPDLSVVPPGNYDAAHPRTIWLVIEVSRSSLRKDRRIKAELYAECAVPEYWIVDLVHGAIEVRTAPRDGTYETVQTYRRGERIRTTRLDIEIAVDDVLPVLGASDPT
jgi:Uma2 family endonuclease